MLARRANDGSSNTTPYTFDGVPGAWQFTNEAPNPAGQRPKGCQVQSDIATPNWGNVTPFSVKPARPAYPANATSYSQLLGSAEYAADLDEVRRLGAYDSTERTIDQTQAAFFWANDLAGTTTPPGQLLDITADVAPTHPVYSGDELGQSHLLASVSIALADAAIAVWDTKFLGPLDIWRPVTAINHPAAIGWKPLSRDTTGIHFSPCFPAWTSGHSGFAGAWQAMMDRSFNGAASFTFTATTSDPNVPPGTTRAFTSFTQAAEENARSRVWLGVHFNFDARDGLAVGRAVGSTSWRAKAINCTAGCLAGV
nr:vanadium-dependent haloperoxidase [Motilibacter aurantiacus]